MNLKILSYEAEGDRIRFVTNNPGRSDFVYIINKFNDLEQFKAEIQKSIEFEHKRQQKRANKLKKIKDDMEANP